MKWATSDHHFNHKGIIEYCDRGFKNVWSMNNTLIDRWNSQVVPGDLVYHLGDFGWGKEKGFGTKGLDEILDALNGQIILIEGSHDKPIKTFLKEKPRYRSKVVKVVPMMVIKEDGHMITLCHYCMRTWRQSHFNSYHLFAHSHGRLEEIGKSKDVGVDTNNFYLYSLDEILEIMETKPDNFNYISKENRRR